MRYAAWLNLLIVSCAGLGASLPGPSRAAQPPASAPADSAAAPAGATIPPWSLKGIALGSPADELRRVVLDVQCETYPDPKLQTCTGSGTVAGGTAVIQVKYLDGKAVWIAVEDLTLDQAKGAQIGLMNKFGAPTRRDQIKIMDRARLPDLYSPIPFDLAVWTKGDVEMKLLPDWQFKKNTAFSAIILVDHRLYEGDWWIRFRQTGAKPATDI